MTASESNKFPDFFEDTEIDPVTAATRSPISKSAPKKKAGFYLSESLLKRFDRQFHQMKLAGIPVENKSALLEHLMMFALRDLELGERSQLLKSIK